jgi:hypothetical protein
MARAANFQLSKDPPFLALQHSAAVAVLARMGFQGDGSEETFKGYVKGLRKLGVPFAPGSHRPRSWLAHYTYENLMELAVALSLRSYNILPDSLVEHLIARRPALGPLYVEAWRRTAQLRRAQVTFRGREGASHVSAGPFLDLRIVQHGRSFAMEGEPRLISTGEALELYGASVATAFLPGPVRLSGLIHLMARALGDPSAGRTRSPLEAHADTLLALLQEDPTLSMADLVARIAKDYRVRTSQRSLRRFLERHLPSSDSPAAEADPPGRRA